MILDCIKAFAVGGVLCAVGQLLIDYTRLTPARILTMYVVTGVVLGAPQTYRYLEQMQERIVSFLTGHSKITRERLLNYMLATDTLTTDMGTVLTGREAVESGLIDCLGGLSDALSWLHHEIAKGK